MPVERWRNPNNLAGVPPIEFLTGGTPWAAVRIINLVQLLEAAGYVPDTEGEDTLDLGALSDDGITL
jgi:hypothetical protein